MMVEWVEGGVWGVDRLTGLSVQRERWLTESSQRTRGVRLHGFSPQSEIHLVLIEEYMVSSLRRNCLILFLNMRIEVVENVIYDIKRTRLVPKRTKKIQKCKTSSTEDF